MHRSTLTYYHGKGFNHLVINAYVFTPGITQPLPPVLNPFRKVDLTGILKDLPVLEEEMSIGSKFTLLSLGCQLP
ncbi:hypothetical protein TNIN_72301 [Trichonephila inaurata madagascariensis]|uniref:Uncharacterized protein n=1 Tax=Trichonephila inaurata madagascariensis TaxID=2747483 RepID=A0A8X7CRX9_9ARAC|nr:hypothetical protein TNIN_72301 [Trichonephila inaurata madagascariensis]